MRVAEHFAAPLNSGLAQAADGCYRGTQKIRRPGRRPL